MLSAGPSPAREIRRRAGSTQQRGSHTREAEPLQALDAFEHQAPGARLNANRIAPAAGRGRAAILQRQALHRRPLQL